MVEPLSGTVVGTVIAVAATAEGLRVAHNAGGQAVNDIGQLMDRNGLAPDSMKKFYDCRECGAPQWVWAGLPYEPNCISCDEKKGIIGQVGSGIEAIGHGFVNLFK